MAQQDVSKKTNYYELANVSFKMNNYKDAIKKLDLALQIDSNDYLSYFLKGKCYSKQIDNNPDNCYHAEQCYLKALSLLEHVKANDIKDREIKRDITIEYANSFIQLVNNNRKIYHASFKKEPKNSQSKAWEKWCDENDVLEENFFLSLKNGIIAFEKGIDALKDFTDLASFTAITHFREYILNFIEELFAYCPDQQNDLKEKWFDTLIAQRIEGKDSSFFSDKLANPLTLDRDFYQTQKDEQQFLAETKKSLQKALNKYCSNNGISQTNEIIQFSGISLPLENRQKVKSEQDLIDESIEEIQNSKKEAKFTALCSAISGICLILAYMQWQAKQFRSVLLLLLAIFTCFPFIYKKMVNQKLARMLRVLTPILLAALALFS